MAKKAYVGVDGVARKIKKGYVGVDGVARRIKKAYIGIGGIARPCWGGSGELEYYGKITDLSVQRHNLAATSVGNYALFGGGYTSSTWSETATVDAYNTSLTRSTPTALSTARDCLAATTVGSYALFGGGETSSYFGTVDAYNTSLTRSKPSSSLSVRSNLTSTTVGNYAVFAGGVDSSSQVATVQAYNQSLTQSSATALDYKRQNLASTTVGNYAIFAGGYYTNGSTTEAPTFINAYNSSLTKTSTGNTRLSAARHNLAAAAVGDYALFGGGTSIGDNISDDKKYLTIVDAFDKSLTRTIPMGFIVGRYNLGATTIGKYAIFGAGINEGGGSSTGNFDIYDTSLTHTTKTVSSCSLNNPEATTIGEYAIFAGSSQSGIPLAFTIA